jgi:hypothetical protein
MATYIFKTVQWKRGLISLFAGTPLDKDGKPVNDVSAVGILAEDIFAPDKTAKVLTAGAWDEDAHTGSGIVISDEVKLKLTGIELSKPLHNRATALKAGTVKQGVNVAVATGSPTKANFNGLLSALKNAGIIAPDEFDLSVLAVPTPAKMPTAETAANSGHATLAISEDNVITIALDCEVADLADADHGTGWGEHKWLGFGVRTGLGSIVGVKFTDDTGASATMAASDATEASDLGLSAGDFVLYIKAEQAEYLTGGKCFTLEADGYAPVTVSMKITETKD